MACRNRSGEEIALFDNPDGMIRFLYDCAAGGAALRVLTLPCISRLTGRLMDTRLSRALIGPFIRKSGIDLSDYEPVRYASFNEFFRRRIREEARPVDFSPEHLIAPCDGKLSVFPIDDDAVFEIKGTAYTLQQLLRSRSLAERFRGGTLMLFRLAVDDYHRYAYPAGGVESRSVHIPGRYHTVNPHAASRRAIYRENTREYSLLRTEQFGAVLMMEIGALLVGKIVNHAGGGPVRRGQEKGYFEFGASSIICCFEKGRVLPDEDLIKNTREGYETRVRFGEKIGKSGAVIK